MALQRPVPPPRRSILAKSTNTPLPSMKKSLTELESDRSAINGEQYSQEEDGSRAEKRRSSASMKNEYLPAPVPAMKNSENRNGSMFISAIANPQYESAIPLRPKSCSNAERTSNLIWFKSGVPPEFTVKTVSTVADAVAATPENPSPLAFSRIDDQSLPSPLTLPPDFPAVASIYPKLPPSPILPVDSRSTAESNVNKSIELEHCRGEVDLQDQEIDHRPPSFTSLSANADGAHAAASPRHSSIGQDSWATAQESILESDVFSLEREKSHPSADSCNLVLSQVSTDGSVSSNASDRTAGYGTQEPWVPGPIPEVTPAPAMDRNERLRLTPVGANICNAGWLNKLGPKKKESQRRWCVLKNGIFEVYSDDTADSPNESVPCKAVEMVFTRTANDPIAIEGDAPNVFTISFLTDARKIENWRFAADRDDDLLVWMTLLTKCIVQGEAADLCEAIDRAGTLYLKKGTTADWEPGWFVMRGKVLLYGAKGDVCCYEVDIRKVIRVRTITDASDCCPLAQSQVPFAFVVSTEGSALYAQSRDATTSRLWRDAIVEALTARTGLISDDRLTTDDIPIIVEKCIGFVAVHGLNVEGIYRHCGTQTKMKILLELFMKDPHSVHLRPDEYTVHDVTSTLRKYFRELDDPLVTKSLRPRFIEKADVRRHKRLLNELPLVNYGTMRKLLGHLKIVSQHANKNMMTVQNLAAIFGRTLFAVDKEEVGEGKSSYVDTQPAIRVMIDMLTNYDELFNVDNAELQKEKQIEEAIEKFETHMVTPTRSQWLLSIHVFEKDANVFNVTITNGITASEVCSFAVTHKKLSRPAGQLALFEVVCNGQLERIVGPDEKLLDVISRWSSWPLEERATNYVIVKLDYFRERLASVNATTYLLTSCDVQFSESKSFRKRTLQCSKGEVLMYKNSKGSKPLQSWPVDKLLWYFGREAKRQPPTEFVLTFIDKDVAVRRSKNNPFFGGCICFQDDSDLVKWLATVTLSNRPLRTEF